MTTARIENNELMRSQQRFYIPYSMHFTSRGTLYESGFNLQGQPIYEETNSSRCMHVILQSFTAEILCLRLHELI